MDYRLCLHFVLDFLLEKHTSEKSWTEILKSVNIGKTVKIILIAIS